jgi:hypothetical protein
MKGPRGALPDGTLTPSITTTVKDKDTGETIEQGTSTDAPSTRCIELMGVPGFSYGNAGMSSMEDWRSQLDERREAREGSNENGPETPPPPPPGGGNNGGGSRVPAPVVPGNLKRPGLNVDDIIDLTGAARALPGLGNLPPPLFLGAVVEEFGDDGCARVFYQVFRDSLMPFEFSFASFGDPIATSWGNLATRAAVARAVSSRSVGTPWRDPVYAVLRRAGKARAAAGPVIALDIAVATGAYKEIKAWASGQCR